MGCLIIAFLANFPPSVLVKQFLKSVYIWRRYGQKFVGTLLWTKVTVIRPIREEVAAACGMMYDVC